MTNTLQEVKTYKVDVEKFLNKNFFNATHLDKEIPRNKIKEVINEYKAFINSLNEDNTLNKERVRERKEEYKERVRVLERSLKEEEVSRIRDVINKAIFDVEISKEKEIFVLYGTLSMEVSRN